MDLPAGTPGFQLGHRGRCQHLLDEQVLFQDLKAIRVPTLILHGKNDRVCLFPLAEAQQQAIPNARLVPFDSCGHFLFYDRMELFNRELIRFVEE
jgi:non-heme chloroperoxidase